MINTRFFQLTLVVMVLLAYSLACTLPDGTVDCNVPDLITAINRANSNPSPTTINLEPSCVYTLTEEDNSATFYFDTSTFDYGYNGLPLIATPITINGNNATIVRDSGAPHFRIFYIIQESSLTINDLTLQNGFADGTLPDGGGSAFPGSGGAIYNDGGFLEANNIKMQFNQATNYGGAVFSIRSATTYINRSTIRENTAPHGGGIFIYHGGLLSIDTSEISDNHATGRGGGISVDHGAEIIIANSLIASNHSNGHGGGIFKDGGANRLPTTITGTIFQDNIAEFSGGGIFIWRTPLTISDSKFVHNQAGDYGGGLGYQNNANETVQITGTTFDENTALLDGGAIHFSGQLMTITGSTFRGNTANNGAGIHNGTADDPKYLTREDTSLTISASIFQENETTGFGGGIFNEGGMNCRETDFFSNKSAAQGGGIHNTGEIEVAGSVFDKNTSGLDGGGLSNENIAEIGASHFTDNTSARGGGLATLNGDTVIIQSTFTGNTASDSGGAIFNFADTPGSSHVEIIGGEIRDNIAPRGGGIASSLGDTRIADSAITGNQAKDNEGGGIYNGGLLTISRSIISGNIANTLGGAIHNLEEMNMVDCTLEGNNALADGGGISTFNKSIISASTFAGNSARRGGGLASLGGNTELTNCTFSANTASDSGGGIFNAGSLVGESAGWPLKASHITIAFNNAPAGGGIATSGGMLEIKNSIVALNPSGADCSVSSGDFSSSGENLDSGASCAGFTLIKDPLLDPLASNGGPTRTHALQPGSPAIDAAPDCTTVGGAALVVDQRGLPRPGGLICDLGAYEEESVALLPSLPYVVFTRVLDCRLEPASSSRALTSFQENERAVVIGRNINLTWYQVAPSDLDETCWVWVGGVDFFGDLDSVEIIPSRGADEDEDSPSQPCQPPQGGCPQLQTPQCWDGKKCVCGPCN